jgi:hypothetical protein
MTRRGDRRMMADQGAWNLFGSHLARFGSFLMRIGGGIPSQRVPSAAIGSLVARLRNP